MLCEFLAPAVTMQRPAESDVGDAPLTQAELAAQLGKFEGYKEKLEADIDKLEQRRAKLQEDSGELDGLGFGAGVSSYTGRAKLCQG